MIVIDKTSDEHIELTFRKLLNGKLGGYIEKSVCELRHNDMEKEMKAIRQMLWGMISMEFVMLVSIITAFVKILIK